MLFRIFDAWAEHCLETIPIQESLGGPSLDGPPFLAKLLVFALRSGSDIALPHRYVVCFEMFKGY